LLDFIEGIYPHDVSSPLDERSDEKVGIIAWIVVGLIAGALGKLIMPGDDPGGIIVTILIGIVGAFVGGFLMNLLGFGGLTGFSIWSIVVATLGAIILLAIYRAVVGGRTT
jgi:uncharacterized membrane protein YeaQ/YmgE (transglycosylase-associated protein family)